MKTEQNLGPLKVIYVDDKNERHARIESDFYNLKGEWRDVYVNFQGYFGCYGPKLFASAPDLLMALETIMDGVAGCEREDKYEKARAAIVKAKGGAA